MNCSFRFSNSEVRFSDSFADSLIRGGRSIFTSFKSFSRLAMLSSLANAEVGSQRISDYPLATASGSVPRAVSQSYGTSIVRSLPAKMKFGRRRPFMNFAAVCESAVMMIGRAIVASQLT